MPSGVCENDWLNLNKRDLPICDLSNTIFNIIDSLSSKYYLPNVRCKLIDTFNKIKKKPKASTKKLSAEVVLNQLFKVS